MGDHYSSTRSRPSLARRLVEASGLVRSLSCVSLILGHARALRTRVRLSLVLALSRFSLVSGQRSFSRQRSLSLSRLVARLSLSTCHSSLLSSLSRFLSIAGQPAFNQNATRIISWIKLISDFVEKLLNFVTQI